MSYIVEFPKNGAMGGHEFEENFLSMFSRHTMNSVDSPTDIVKLGPKLMKAALSSNLLEIDWKTLESEVHLPPFHKLRTLDSDYLSSLLVVTSLCMEKLSQVSVAFQKQ